MTMTYNLRLPTLCALIAVALLAAGPFVAEEAGKDEAPVKKVKMYARSWEWTPDQIRVKVGTRVIIDFISEDASHAFFLKAYKIKVNLPQDSKARVEFVADKVGEFPWRCSRPCGNGCAKMRGTLIVAE
jgi:cytochrome c oxidase subunit 2